MKTALALAKEGLNKQELLSLLINKWEIPDHEQEHYGIISYLRQWDSSYVRESIHEGTIGHTGYTYCVVYRSCSPATLKNYKRLNVSFREAAIGNFAIIQPVLEPQTQSQQ